MYGAISAARNGPTEQVARIVMPARQALRVESSSFVGMPRTQFLKIVLRYFVYGVNLLHYK